MSLRTLRSRALLAACLVCGPVLAAADSVPALIGEGPAAVTGADLLTETSTLDAKTRESILGSPQQVHRIGMEMYIRRALAAQALTQKLDEDPEVKRLLHVVRERVLADSLARRTEAQSRPTTPVLEKLAQQNYQAQQARFKIPDMVHARHILIPPGPDARAQAEALRKQILEGASFEELAKTHSKDPGSAPKGGDLGFFPRAKMVKPFDDAVFALAKPGDVSGLVETRFGFHIIQLVEKRLEGVRPFAEVKEQLVEEAATGIATTARQELVRPIIDTAKPNQDAIEAFSAAHRPAGESEAAARKE